MKEKLPLQSIVDPILFSSFDVKKKKRKKKITEKKKGIKKKAFIHFANFVKWSTINVYYTQRFWIVFRFKLHRFVSK